MTLAFRTMGGEKRKCKGLYALPLHKYSELLNNNSNVDFAKNYFINDNTSVKKTPNNKKLASNDEYSDESDTMSFLKIIMNQKL